ncbi:MAG: uroporphyrinogen-III C-methyltransferase [Bryobacteraceae bacterium]
MLPKAKVYLVGAGPGDPDLLTVKAARILAQAACVIHDRLVSPGVLALANPHAILIDAGKTQGEQESIQQEIFRCFLRQGDRVSSIVRLKSGDPTVFGRAGEELAFLASHGFETEIVPGISSAIAAPALAGIPLTLRGVATSFAVVAGHRQSVTAVDWAAYAGIDTLVVLMGVEFRDLIAGSLIGHGRPADQPVAFIENASTSRERYVETTLDRVARRMTEVSAPAVMVIGEVVRHRIAETAAAHREAAA